jgi:hypothetical protein
MHIEEDQSVVKLVCMRMQCVCVCSVYAYRARPVSSKASVYANTVCKHIEEDLAWTESRKLVCMHILVCSKASVYAYTSL